MMKLKVYKVTDNELPSYSKPGDAGKDIRASEKVIVLPRDTVIVHTGIYASIPKGYEIQVRPRSGLSFNTKLRVANSPGTIDSNYKGEICIILDNLGSEEIMIRKGDRIAQLVLAVVPEWDWELVDSLEDLGESNRGINGFGSTGVQ